MIKVILFDVDGMVNKRARYFSHDYSEEFGVPYQEMQPFFEKEFLDCEVGKADLKIELAVYLLKWKWEKPVEEFLEYWFSRESNLDSQMLDSVAKLRSGGLKCYLQTRNEKYRTGYLWDTLGLKKHFDGIFSSADLGFMKPQIEFWAAIYKKLGDLKKDEVLVWDDKMANVQSARDFGFQAELFSDFDSYQDYVNKH